MWKLLDNFHIFLYSKKNSFLRNYSRKYGICKIEAAIKYKIDNLRPPNVVAEKLLFTYVLKLEISVKKIALCQKDSVYSKIIFLLKSKIIYSVHIDVINHTPKF